MPRPRGRPRKEMLGRGRKEPKVEEENNNNIIISTNGFVQTKAARRRFMSFSKLFSILNSFITFSLLSY